ncbi:uncharacterized protein LOC115245476 [Formica exsecta]|uniref:uncharacterized protein LOC115245476 n=1 Tax=Formica exsecta TaxID=72781 RepID=UPI001143CDAD|nr:uncharacterized protein LOC115245476 [Formica exsecta]
MKLTMESEWNRWEKNFCETFANKGWSPIRYALAFKYQADLIAFGLPNYVADKVDRETLQGTEDLYNEIGKLEHLAGKNKYDKKSIIYSGTKSKKIEEKKPCQICVNEKKGKRYHLEDNCWFKGKNQKAVVKIVNNSELEIELNEKFHP